ncbi:02dcdde2-9ca5-42e5-b0a3-c5f0bd9b37f5 [Thermothielavioides terrestris]|uniref:02dcdde2-9ca5-42e5-b0a3-c5f0bd9b37f5 n=1 Tax=Thermothielavioides terrestris TaxID=2587410 RepID=A0A3S4B1W2_9PEZI|nr:02dcdde2-9ca5-42e5-b0a3-c5f0bd9b37f5 [Thermothielavioides terrestris]
MASTPTAGLNVIALISGGKDSFFSLLHCQANGHRIVALANLHPPQPPLTAGASGKPSDGTSHPPAAAISAGPAASAAAVSAPALQPGVATPDSGPRQVPDQDGPPAAVMLGCPGGAAGNEMATEAGEDEHDLNSFMYQTVGHQVVPLYAEATGIPLYRRAIAGGATQPGKEYSHYRRSGEPPERRSPSGFTSRSGGDARHALGQHDDLQEPGDVAGSPQHAGPEEHRHPADDGTAPEEPDETESMVPLLQAIQKAHPEANALCAGAILSTYQRTRVESVATRLGLTP